MPVPTEMPSLHFPLTKPKAEIFFLFERQEADSYAVVLLMSWTLCSGSMVSGQRRIQGAKTIAKALADIRFVSSCKAILKAEIIVLCMLYEPSITFNMKAHFFIT